MVKKQQLPVGGLTCVLSSRSSRSFNKQQATASAGAEVLPCHPSSSSSSAWPWQWTSCGMHPRTLSFRQQQQQPEQEENGHGRHHHHDSHSDDNHVVKMAKQQQEQEEAAYCKTMDSVYSVDFSADSSSASVDSFASTASEEDESDAEAVIQALRSDRLLYEPQADTDDDDDDDTSCCRLIKHPSPSKQSQSINKQKQAAVAGNDGDGKLQLHTNSIVLSSSSKAKAPVTTAEDALAMFGGATAMSVDSRNPYRDFRESMEAMVMSQQGTTKDWRWLEEMLAWYLRANGKTTHGLIVAAFVDLLLALTTSSPPAAAAAAAAD